MSDLLKERYMKFRITHWVDDDKNMALCENILTGLAKLAVYEDIAENPDDVKPDDAIEAVMCLVSHEVHSEIDARDDCTMPSEYLLAHSFVTEAFEKMAGYLSTNRWKYAREEWDRLDDPSYQIQTPIA